MAWWEQRYNTLINTPTQTPASGTSAWWQNRVEAVKKLPTGTAQTSPQPAGQPNPPQPLFNFSSFLNDVKTKVTGVVNHLQDEKRREAANKRGQELTQNIQKGLVEFSKELLRATPRAAVSTALQVSRQKKLTPGEIPQTAKFEGFLYGDKPIYDFQGEGEQTIQSFGGNKEIAAKYGLPLGLALTGLDLIPGFSKKKAAEVIAKESNERAIFKFLKSGVFKNASDEVAEALAKRLAPIKDPDVVQTELDFFTKVDRTALTGRALDVSSEQLLKNRQNVVLLGKAPEIGKPLQPLAEEVKKYPTIHQGGVIKEVEGQPVKIMDGIDTFLHKGDGGWIVSEASTGRFIAESTSQEGVIAKAGVILDSQIKNNGIDKVKQFLEENKFSNGVTSIKTPPPKPGTSKIAQQPDLQSVASKSIPGAKKARELQTELEKAVQQGKTTGRPSDFSISQLPKAQNEIINLFKDATPKTKVNLLDYLRTPDRVLTKIGLGKEAQLLKQKYRDYIIDLPKEIDKITQWAKQADDKGSSQRIFKYLDGQKGVTLSQNEAKIADEIKDYFAKWADKLGLPEDRRISSYITHIFEEDLIKKEFDPDLAKLIADKVPGSVYDPFLQQRYGVAGYKEDAWQALDAYVKRATRKFHMDQALEPLKKAADMLDIESFNYVKRLADKVNLRPSEVDSLIDNFMKSTPVGYKLGGRPVARISRALRQIIYRGALGFNVASALRNLTQGANTYAKLGEKYTIKGYYGMIKDFLSGSDELKRVGVLADNIVQDRYLNATKKFWEKADKGLFGFFSAAERINRGAAYFGGKSRALTKGATEAEAIQAGIKTVEDTQFVFGSVDTPVALQNDIVKVLTQFQSFNVKQTEFLGEMIKNKEFGGLVRFAGANVFFALTIGQLFGMKPQDMVPFLSNVTEGRFGSPAIQALGGGTKAVFGDEQASEQGKDELKKVAPTFIPGGAQGKKTIEGIKAYQQGASTTASGRTRFKIEQDPVNALRTAIFGQYSAPGAKKYFDNLGKAKAQVVYEEITKLKTSKERVDAWNKMVTDGTITKGNISDIRQWFKDEELGVTDSQRKMRKLGVEDYSRARAVVKEVTKLDSNKERNAYITDLMEKKVISEQVVEQVVELINKQK